MASGADLNHRVLQKEWVHISESDGFKSYPLKEIKHYFHKIIKV